MALNTVVLEELSLLEEVRPLLARLGVEEMPANAAGSVSQSSAAELEVRTPITGQVIARLRETSESEAQEAIETAYRAFLVWRNVPPPRRGELVRALGEELRAGAADLGRLVTLETGKILSEGLGEVQEMIDICGFAASLSRQLEGRTIASERADHRMMETWHPLGVVGVISAFNFPVAVWSWNAALALVCGDAVVWKPSEKAPLTALAVQALFLRAAAKVGGVPEGLCSVLPGGARLGELLVDSPRIALLSATGSTAMGRAVGPRLASRFGRALLELGGNNAAIVCPSADLDLTLRAASPSRPWARRASAAPRCAV